MIKLKWENLLCQERIRASPSKNADNIRNGFKQDCDRMVSLSSLRQLQDMTQVFPLQEFTRTRFDSFARSFSYYSFNWKRIGEQLVKHNKKKEDKLKKLKSLLVVCGLVHDLGNPPFGCCEEDAIKWWVKEHSVSYQNCNI